jgi:hypothetical protein
LARHRGAKEADPPAPDRLDDLLEFLAPSGSVIGSPDEPLDGKSRYGADITVEANGPAEAIERAIGMLNWAAEKAGLPIWPVVRVEAKTDEELDVELAQPAFPELIGVSELAELEGTSRQRASYLARSESFPAPLARLNSGPVWAKPSVRRFLDAWRRKPGRPVKERKPASPGSLVLNGVDGRGGFGNRTGSRGTRIDNGKGPAWSG